MLFHPFFCSPGPRRTKLSFMCLANSAEVSGRPVSAGTTGALTHRAETCTGSMGPFVQRIRVGRSLLNRYLCNPLRHSRTSMRASCHRLLPYHGQRHRHHEPILCLAHQTHTSWTMHPAAGSRHLIDCADYTKVISLCRVQLDRAECCSLDG